MRLSLFTLLCLSATLSAHGAPRDAAELRRVWVCHQMADLCDPTDVSSEVRNSRCNARELGASGRTSTGERVAGGVPESVVEAFRAMKVGATAGFADYAPRRQRFMRTCRQSAMSVSPRFSMSFLDRNGDRKRVQVPEEKELRATVASLERADRERYVQSRREIQARERAERQQRLAHRRAERQASNEEQREGIRRCREAADLGSGGDDGKWGQIFGICSSRVVRGEVNAASTMRMPSSDGASDSAH